LNDILSKVFRVFLLQTHTTPYSFYSALVYTVKEKGGKPDKKPHRLSYGLRNPYRNLKSVNSQDYAQNLKEVVSSFQTKKLY
jgi:hypothetical protein